MTEDCEYDGIECVATMGDGGGWFSIVRAGTWASISWASVEGPIDDMEALADALEDWRPFRAKRCAVKIDGERFWLSSPRNTIGRGVSFPRAYRDGLIRSIRSECSIMRAHIMDMERMAIAAAKEAK